MSAVPAVARSRGAAGDARARAGSEPDGPARPRRRPEREERRLARALHRRRPDALPAVYDRYGGPAFGFLLRLLGDRGAAEDVLQVVFTEVWQRAGDYDPRRASLLTWILTIARSRAIDHLRRRVPEPRDPAGAAALLDRESPGEDPSDLLLADARLGWLLTRLPSEEAEVLRLRFREDRTQAEIAEALELPLGTVKMRMVQALRRLHALLEDEESAA